MKTGRRTISSHCSVGSEMNAGVERLILNKIPICQLRSGPPGHQSDGSGKKVPALQRRKKRNSNVCNA